ncbi:hypothetical protein [Leucobacter luti]|uniref:hypothetical protein n=1 Tax=Leucobacter luti TaxID=340320 RepID=UPI003D04421D
MTSEARSAADGRRLGPRDGEVGLLVLSFFFGLITVFVAGFRIRACRRLGIDAGPVLRGAFWVSLAFVVLGAVGICGGVVSLVNAS